jgi:hypothetical protein
MAGRDLFVIVDGDHVAEWQRRALATLPAEDRLTLLSCTNTSMPRQLARRPLYYALNLLSVRNPLTRPVPIGDLAATVVAREGFAAGKDGAWQTLPEAIVARIRDARPFAVIKLGMTLMRVPADLGVPILSWHHGDPDEYRGRPAGFYELLHRRATMGQIVQVIGNRLDAGAVVAYAETRVIPHSWRATLVESFRHSPLLLEEALRNLTAGRTIAKHSRGRNYRLPGNRQVAAVSAGTAARAAGRIAYGALVEKKWQVSTIPVAGVAEAAALAGGSAPFPPAAGWHSVPLPAGYTFLADPFFHADGKDLLVEALGATSGKGEILLVAGGTATRVSREPGHFSYPAPVRDNGVDYVVPEIANWSEPRVYRLESDGLREAGRLDIPGNPRLSDPTFHWHEGRLWLFGNVHAVGSNALYLWHADSLFSRFEPHPMNPIRVSPRGARMAGAILPTAPHPIRLGQDFTDGYGNGLFAFAIEELTPRTYRETEIGALRLEGRKGPHTLNLSADGTLLVFDWYQDRFSPFAGLRRFRSRFRPKAG